MILWWYSINKLERVFQLLLKEKSTIILYSEGTVSKWSLLCLCSKNIKFNLETQEKKVQLKSEQRRERHHPLKRFGLNEYIKDINCSISVAQSAPSFPFQSFMLLCQERKEKWRCTAIFWPRTTLVKRSRTILQAPGNLDAGQSVTRRALVITSIFLSFFCTHSTQKILHLPHIVLSCWKDWNNIETTFCFHWRSPEKKALWTCSKTHFYGHHLYPYGWLLFSTMRDIMHGSAGNEAHNLSYLYILTSSRAYVYNYSGSLAHTTQ